MNSSFDNFSNTKDVISDVIMNSQHFEKLKNAKISTEMYKTNEKILFHKNTLNIYGPKLWYLIHFFGMLADNKNEDYIKSYIAFIECTYELFPCPMCKAHYKKNLEKYNIKNYQNKYLEWSCLIHNEVNMTNMKPDFTVSECSNIYENQKNKTIYLDNILYILYTFATTYKIENFKYYKCLVVVFGNLIPDIVIQEIYIKALKIYILDDYKKSYSEVFYWVYLINTYINCQLGNAKLDYYNLKHFFLNVL
jgi:hypothetical protein